MYCCDNDSVSYVIVQLVKLPSLVLMSVELRSKRGAISTLCLTGTQSIYVKTWGCSHNNSDSEYMAGQLAAYGYTITGMCSCIMYVVSRNNVCYFYFSHNPTVVETLKISI